MSQTRLFKENRQFPSLRRLVGNSPAMQQVHRMIERIARGNTTVLLQSETGTGKELAAEAIHSLSSRASAPLVRVNCAAVPESLLESELFGHVKGAFTGAIRSRTGHFEAAQGGSLFLDEISEISPATQVLLLRALEERQIQRIGCNKTHCIDLRVIAATNKNLAAEVASGRFRADLFFRLNVVTLTLPPLRERREDIPPLVKHFIHHFNQFVSQKIEGITAEAMDELMRRSWPGNVRELKNTIECAFVYAQGNMIEVKDLAPCAINLPRPTCEERRTGERRSPYAPPMGFPLSKHRGAKPDSATLHKILEQHHWHLGRTAAALGMHRTTLWRYMHRLGVTIRT